ncbi:hypothetical protein SEEERB17_004514 [Salmonella enterica subsp. enterica serovar Enteritidis str. SARB17]|nr:hypothetical protein SEEERB17_004514 [Salmonella enterica subsp. enterica serovar Enteritidis str. SARB17]
MQLISLAQSEKASCVSLPLCADQTDALIWCRNETLRFWCSLTLTRQQSLRQCRPQPVSVKDADCQQEQVCRKDPGAGADYAGKKPAA